MSVLCALELGDPGFHYYLTGGEFQSRSNSLSGRFALDNLNLVFANKVILGVDGISLKHGCTVPTNPEAEVVRKMIERTKGQVIVAADHSKWGAVSNFPCGNIEEWISLSRMKVLASKLKKDWQNHSIETC
jgi:DeoR/GlpR family transcriptional regulator of sugar metabolism